MADGKTEKLTACGECKWFFEVDPGQYWCTETSVQKPRFNVYDGTFSILSNPDCSTVNTDGHCPHYEAKQ